MPDIKILTPGDDGTVIEIPKFNDSTFGIDSLAQTVVLMLLDPNYGDLKSMTKQRIENGEARGLILSAIDMVQHSLIDEQGAGIFSDDEILLSLDIESMTISADSIDIILRVTNILDNQTTVTI